MLVMFAFHLIMILNSLIWWCSVPQYLQTFAYTELINSDADNVLEACKHACIEEYL